MEKIDRAIQEGLDITLELYPYPYGASYAPMLVPPWASEGGVDAILKRLTDPQQRRRIADYIDREFPLFDGVIAYAGEDSSSRAGPSANWPGNRGRAWDRRWPVFF